MKGDSCYTEKDTKRNSSAKFFDFNKSFSTSKNIDQKQNNSVIILI